MDNSTFYKDQLRGRVEIFILQSLNERDKYGYEILFEINEKAHGTFAIKQPTLYNCLKRLESDGSIDSYLGEESKGGQRRYYTLTDEGRETLRRNILEWEFSRTLVDSLLSERKFDLENEDVPFSQSELKPLTKRQRGSKPLNIPDEDFNTHSAGTLAYDDTDTDYEDDEPIVDDGYSTNGIDEDISQTLCDSSTNVLTESTQTDDSSIADATTTDSASEQSAPDTEYVDYDDSARRIENPNTSIYDSVLGTTHSQNAETSTDNSFDIMDVFSSDNETETNSEEPYTVIVDPEVEQLNREISLALQNSESSTTDNHDEQSANENVISDTVTHATEQTTDTLANESTDVTETSTATLQTADATSEAATEHIASEMTPSSAEQTTPVIDTQALLAALSDMLNPRFQEVMSRIDAIESAPAVSAPITDTVASDATTIVSDDTAHTVDTIANESIIDDDSALAANSTIAESTASLTDSTEDTNVDYAGNDSDNSLECEALQSEDTDEQSAEIIAEDTLELVTDDIDSDFDASVKPESTIAVSPTDTDKPQQLAFDFDTLYIDDDVFTGKKEPAPLVHAADAANEDEISTPVTDSNSQSSIISQSTAEDTPSTPLEQASRSSAVDVVDENDDLNTAEDYSSPCLPMDGSEAAFRWLYSTSNTRETGTATIQSQQSTVVADDTIEQTAADEQTPTQTIYSDPRMDYLMRMLDTISENNRRLEELILQQQQTPFNAEFASVELTTANDTVPDEEVDSTATVAAETDSADEISVDTNTADDTANEAAATTDTPCATTDNSDNDIDLLSYFYEQAENSELPPYENTHNDDEEQVFELSREDFEDIENLHIIHDATDLAPEELALLQEMHAFDEHGMPVTLSVQHPTDTAIGENLSLEPVQATPNAEVATDQRTIAETTQPTIDSSASTTSTVATESGDERVADSETLEDIPTEYEDIVDVVNREIYGEEIESVSATETAFAPEPSRPILFPTSTDTSSPTQAAFTADFDLESVLREGEAQPPSLARSTRIDADRDAIIEGMFDSDPYVIARRQRQSEQERQAAERFNFSLDGAEMPAEQPAYTQDIEYDSEYYDIMFNNAEYSYGPEGTLVRGKPEHVTTPFDNDAPMDYYAANTPSYRRVMDSVFAESKKRTPVVATPAGDKPVDVSFETLRNQMQTGGYHLKAYSADSSVQQFYNNSHIFKNRLRADASIMTYILVLVEMLGVYLFANQYVQKSVTEYIFFGLVLAVIPLFAVIRHLVDRNYRREADFVFKRTFSTALMVLTELAAIIALVGWSFFDVVFTDIATMIIPVLIPVALLLNILVYIVVYSLLYKSGKYYVTR